MANWARNYWPALDLSGRQDGFRSAAELVSRPLQQLKTRSRFAAAEVGSENPDFTAESP
jgi:hypothetical protein